MANISFKRGSNLNNLAIADGQFIINTAERSIYVDVGAERLRIGDFVSVANTDALPTAGANETALYYVEDINCLAKWNGAGWTQINRDSGAVNFTVTGEGNAITDVSYDAKTRTLTLTKGVTFTTPAVVDGKISDKVGAIDGTVKDYVDEKTSGIASDAALTELAGRVTTAESDIDDLQAAIGKDGSVTLAIKAAHDAADAAQATADGAQEAAESAQSDVNTLKDKVGTVPDGSTVVGMIGDIDTSYKAKDAELATDIKTISDDYLKSTDKTELQDNIDEKVDQTTYDAKIAELVAADTTLQNNIDAEKTVRETADNAQVARIIALEGQITGLSGAMHFEGVKGEVPADVTGYEAGDVIIVGEKEYVFNGTAFVEFGDVSAEGKRIDALETTVGKTAEGENPATGLIKDITDNAAAITAEETRAKAAEATNKALAEAAQSAADAVQDDVDAIAADYLKGADKTELQGNIDGVSDRVKAIEDKKISDGANKVEASTTNGNIKIDGVDTVVYTHPAEHVISEVTGLQDALNAKATQTSLDTTNANVQANAEAIADLESGKADKATTLAGYGITNAYMKSETYSQVEVNALLSWGEF